MASIQDDRGYNQGFQPSRALEIRTRRRRDYILEHARVPAGGRILEMGCGTGQLSYLLAEASQAQVVGSDICRPFIEEARKTYPHPRLTYEVFDSNRDLEIGRFNAIVGNGILHHLYRNLDAALAQIRQTLEPGGRIVFLEPNLLNPYVFLIFSFAPLRKLARLEPDEMAFGRAFIRSRLERNGFAKIEVEYKDFLLPNTPDAFIGPVIQLGDWLEKLPVINRAAQSIFISAETA
jgi:2-polyprenyl-3-methyl-5-hydroxy-6-metoxy-1,4-benzoquinol methylase